ncbi:MAG: hypothetical protein HY233_00725 [Acidobacteriales bacterium]|nr:hypothetical protein [Terriglobales bacterium]
MRNEFLLYVSGGLHTALHVLLSKAVLLLYRVFAIVALYGVLVGVFAYAVMLGVYAINTSWIAPVILAPTDQRSLDVTERLITTRNSLEDLTLEMNRQKSLLAEMKQHRAALKSLQPELEAAVVRERQHNKVAAKDLLRLNQQKRADIDKTRGLVDDVNGVEAEIQRDLAANLITKGEAAIQRAQLNQTRNAATDSQINEVLLRDSVLQKSTIGTQILDVLDKRAELESQIAQLDISIAIAGQEIATVQAQVERLNKAINLATQTPYFLAVSGEETLHFAFVPYDNRTSVWVGAPVYDCYLHVLLCRQVGTVKRIFESEEKTQNPIFRTDMRGFLIQLDLQNEESAKSKTLFLNHRPLLL